MRLPLAGLVGLALVVLLAGCTADDASSVESLSENDGLPPGMVSVPDRVERGSPFAVWLDEGASIGLVLFGSGTCPYIGSSMKATSSNTISVDVAPLPKRPCTRDLRAHTTVFPTPEPVSTSSDVTTQVLDATLTLPAL